MSERDEDIHVLERRIVATQAVRQVVHAIWALGRAQLPLARRAAADATVYLDWTDAVVARLARREPRLDVRQTLWVVFGPERAYCGALPRQIAAQIPHSGEVGLVGQRLTEVARAASGLEARVRFLLPGAVAHDEHGEVAERVAAEVLRHARDRDVVVLHPTHGQSQLHRAGLLVGGERLMTSPVSTLSPLGVVLEQAVRESVAGRLVVASAEALWSEVEARTAAADAARKASDSRLEELGTTLSSAHQEQTTSEILEVVAGRLATLDPFRA